MSFELQLSSFRKSYYRADLLGSIFSSSSFKKKKKNEARTESDKKFWKIERNMHEFLHRLPWSFVTSILDVVPSWRSKEGTASMVF